MKDLGFSDTPPKTTMEPEKEKTSTQTIFLFVFNVSFWVVYLGKFSAYIEKQCGSARKTQTILFKVHFVPDLVCLVL